MFGYVTANTKALTAEEFKVYRGMYCGLCRTLKKRYGQKGRVTLTYDMTFLILVLSSLYDVDERSGYERCAVHPAKKHFYVVNRFTDYAADMNIALSYNKLMDDWNDDRNIASKAAADLLKKDYYSIWDKHTKQCAALEKRLSELAEVEKKGILSPDIPADIFGHLLAEIFVIRDDQYTDTLKKSMAALGRFIYIMDAWDDLDDDIKKEKYNPLTAMNSSAVEPVLTMLISECAENLFTLPFKRNEGIIKNIIYSGVWSKYSLKTAKEAKKNAKQTDSLKKD